MVGEGAPFLGPLTPPGEVVVPQQRPPLEYTDLAGMPRIELTEDGMTIVHTRQHPSSTAFRTYGTTIAVGPDEIAQLTWRDGRTMRIGGQETPEQPKL